MKRSEVFNTLRIVVLGFMLLLILFVGYLNFGYRPVVVISNSMEPKYLTNSVVLVDTKVKFKDLEVGDVINYNHNEHKGIVHRVFQKNEIKKGTVILTSGINPDTNKIVDNWVVLEEMYQGKVVKGYNWTAPIITFLFGNLVDKNPLHILFGFSIIFLIVLGLIVGSIKLINLIKRGCIKMRERVVTTDVYMITEHKKDRIKPSIKFKGVLGKMVVSALVISTLTTATGNVYAATPIDAAEKYNHTATITYNYEISIENKVFEVEQTIKAIEEMKAKGIVSNETLTKLANELMSLEQAVQLSGKGVTKEAEDVVLRAEETVKGVKGAETVIAVISIVKDTLGIESVIISNKEAQATVTSFSDVQKGQWFYNDVMTLSGKGIISGVSAPVNGVGKYDPQGTVSLGQFLAISTRLVAKDNIKEITNAAHWAVPNYVAAIESGLISSRDFSSTVEALNSGISREDMAYILVNVAKMNGETLTRKDGIKNNIKDFNSISKGRQEAVMKAYSNGLLVGDNAGNFNPKKTLTRAEVAAVFCRVMNYTTRPTVEVKIPEVGVRQPMTLRYDDPYRPKAIEGDTFITADGREVVLKVDPQTGILGFGQNVATELGRIGGTKGEPIVHGCLGGDSVNDEFLGQPYWIDSRTGMGLYRQQWLDVKRKIDPYKEVKNPTEGQLYKDYFKYRDGVWSWIGPVK